LQDKLVQIFFSYANKDSEFALALSNQLAKRGFRVWIMEDEVFPGDNIWLRAGEALKSSRAMVVLLSPDSVRSENLRREIEYALGSPAYEGRVFPVLVRPTKHIPGILRKLKVLNGKQNVAKLGAFIAESLKQVA
jgi:TIR domain-containing protein